MIDAKRFVENVKDSFAKLTATEQAEVLKELQLQQAYNAGIENSQAFQGADPRDIFKSFDKGMIEREKS